MNRIFTCVLSAGLAVLVGVFLLAVRTAQCEPPNTVADLQTDYVQQIRPLVSKYCLGCHSTKASKGELDLERFTSLEAVRKDLKPWQHVAEQVEVGEMPPAGKPQPTAAERKTLVRWARAIIDREARLRKGDPGRALLRRLSNTEYDCTVRDLTGVDLRPAREFPADGAAGEGFTNAGESLSDITPALFTRYLAAAKEIADHAVLLPDGFRFSPSKTRRDWTDEGTASLRKFYAVFASGDGKLVVLPYLLATVRHREALAAGKIAEVAAKEKVNAKYLGILWNALNEKTSSQPLEPLRAKWSKATEKDVAGLAADVTAWQAALWKTVKVGNYVRDSWGTSPSSPKGYQESLSRQVAIDPPALESVPLRLAIKPDPGQSEVTVYLAGHEAGPVGPVLWQRPRFEAAGKPTLLLRDYAEFGPAFEVDLPSAFVNSAQYLAAAVTLANDPKASAEGVAREKGLDPAFLKQWVKTLAVLPRKAPAVPTSLPIVPLTLLESKTAPNKANSAILGWSKQGTDLPVVVANSSDRTAQIPGRVSGHTVGVHPMPQEFVAVAWKSPIAGTVRITARVAHAHPACGNGVAWWLEHRRSDHALRLGSGTLGLGEEIKLPAKTVEVGKGDQIVLAIDARDNNHVCDMTEIWLTIADDANRVWDLGKDVASDVQASNPHADKHGNADTWSFVRGPSLNAKTPGATAAPLVPANSVLARWRSAASDPDRKGETEQLAKEVEKVLSGLRAGKEKDPDRVLYDQFVAADGPLFAGVEVKKVAKSRIASSTLGLPRERFAKPDGDSLIAPSDSVLAIRLPATIFVGREFVVDARVPGAVGDRLVRVRAAATAPNIDTRWEGAMLGSAESQAYRTLLAGHAEFRRLLPLFVCFPLVVPSDEVVTLKMFHREDEPLIRLFLGEDEVRGLDRLWAEQRFISRQPAAEFDYLPQFMAYTTQDTPQGFQQFFIDRKPLFQKHAEEFVKEESAAVSKQLDMLLAFAEKAYRRPITAKDKAELHTLYEAIRKKKAPPEEAFRGVLARVFLSPSFLFRIEQPAPGANPGPIDDWELASRLSYFLWSSMPDEKLRQLAAAGKLHDPAVLSQQTRRMLKDDRLRSLAIEFGTQWIHVREFDNLKEKNEKLFPTFTPELRKAIYEESILFFHDLFKNDRPVTNLLDSDGTYLNALLAKHYNIPGIVGPEFRRVEGVRKHGRGGILGLASVHARQAGASRTSPVLRGNWVVETLLGEKLPRPPANVPILPDEEGGEDKRTTRQQVERHVSDRACASCHVRIDPFGFAFENFDAIGRWRTKEVSGVAVDARAKLRDGTEFEGIDGLRTYLLTKKKEVIVRLFCQRLLGYALGRATTLADSALIDEMVAELNANEGRLSAAILTIVRSTPFRMIRGSETAANE